MRPLLLMSFLLARYWARPRQTCAGAAIRCPEALVRDLAHNSLEVSDTVTDGNCGVHGFGLSLADGGKHNKILSSTHAFKEFRAMMNTNTEGMIAYLRKRCVDAMVKIKNHIMWEGMEFKNLALSMSSEKESFDAYLTRMAADGIWLDANAIHTLATSFKVDVLVWQQGMDQTILGHSLSRNAASAYKRSADPDGWSSDASGAYGRSADRDWGLVKRVEQLKKQVHQLQTQNTLLRTAGLIQMSPRVDAGAAGSGGAGAGGAGAGGSDAGGSAAGGADADGDETRGADAGVADLPDGVPLWYDPFCVLDRIRDAHGLDIITSMSMSQTHLQTDIGRMFSHDARRD